MTANSRSLIGRGYFVAVLLLGGASAAGLIPNALLGLVGAALIGWSLWNEPASSVMHTGLRPVLFALAGLAVLQFIPLPPAIWTLLPGREAVASGYALAQMPLPWLGLSLDPWSSLQSLVWWIPALAVFAMMRAQPGITSRQVITAITYVGYLSVVLAVMQVFGGSSYFYAITNRGNGVGLFANSNHFADFMLVAMALTSGQWLHDRPAVHRITPALATGRVLIVRLAPFALGVFLSGSLAGAILFFPVAAAIFLLYRPLIKVRWPVVVLAAPVLAAAMLWLLASGLVSNDLMAKSGTAGISRGEFLTNGIAMAKTFAPFGSGLGTFRELYPWFEKLQVVGTTYVNHAHNDWLEFLIETGVLGIAVLALFLRWFAARLRDLLTSHREGNPVAVAASIAVAIALAHSLADYPTRTATISCMIAACFVMMCRAPESRGNAPVASRTERRDPVSI
ncbi:MAG: O-antigen ligase family protein [Novosphingobium sp.]